MNTSAAKFHLYDRKIENAVTSIEEELKVVREQGNPADFHRLMSLYIDVCSSERRMALNEMYLGESIAVAAERLLNDEDRRAVGEITTLLKAL